MAKSLKPKKGLEVKIIAGKYKGQVGKVLTVFPKTNKLIIEVSKDYYRPAEVDILIGSSEKAKKQLGWEAQTDVKSLASIMVSFDRKRLA